MPFDELAQPTEDLAVLVINLAALFVFPMRGNPVVRDAMHLFRANLKFDVFAFRADDGSVERLIQVGLWNRDVILEASWHRPPQRMDQAQDRVAIHLGIRNDPDGGE